MVHSLSGPAVKRGLASHELAIKQTETFKSFTLEA